MERIVGLLFSAAAIRIAGAGLALWIGIEVAGYAFDLIASAGAAFPR